MFFFFASSMSFFIKGLHSSGLLVVYHAMILSKASFCAAVHLRHLVTNASAAFSARQRVFG